MGDSTRRTVPASTRAGIALAAAWAGWLWGIPAGFPLLRWLCSRIVARDFHGSWLFDLLTNLQFLLRATLLPVLIGATIALVLGALGRTVARARLRAGYADPLESARAWASRHPRAMRALLWTPALSWLTASTAAMVYLALGWGDGGMYGDWVQGLARMHLQYAAGMAASWCLTAPLALGIRALTSVGWSALLAPTVARPEQEAQAGSVDERLHFDAVAVTAETRAAVVAMALLPVLLVVGAGAAGLRNAGTEAAIAAYAAIALAGAFAFRRASRVAVGVDGVFVTGSSRTRFFGYKDIDGAGVHGGDLVLERQKKVVLRLQLHGKDAACREALLARLQDAIRAAHARTGAATAEVVASVSSSELARAAAGASDYRSPAVTRDQLWGVVEGTEHDAATRTAAARALAHTQGGQDRGRLRVAAARCAEPELRVELLDLAEESDDPIAVLPRARMAR